MYWKYNKKTYQLDKLTVEDYKSLTGSVKGYYDLPGKERPQRKKEEEVKPEEIKPEEVKPEEAKPEEVKKSYKRK